MRLLLAVLSAGLVSWIPAGAAAQNPRGDSVTGSGTAAQSQYSFAFDAHSGPSGENPTGSVSTSLTFIPSVFSRGQVTCLAVQGNHATIGMVNDPGSVGQFTLIEVTDNPDTLMFTFSPRPFDCSEQVGSEPLMVTIGDIAIVDAPPLPTSKDQCKNGGWRDFHAFKNQGDCVSYVATKGKNQPSGH